ELRVLAQRLIHLLDGNDAVGSWFQIRNAEPFRLELLERIEHGLVLRTRRDDVLTTIRVKARGAEQGEIVRLRRAGCPNDTFRTSLDGRCNVRARLLHPCACASS